MVRLIGDRLIGGHDWWIWWIGLILMTTVGMVVDLGRLGTGGSPAVVTIIGHGGDAGGAEVV